MKMRRTTKGSVPVYDAVQSGDVKRLKVLLKLGVDRKLLHGALFDAALSGKLEIIQELLKAGANPIGKGRW